jgi:hypothetical protein
MTTPDRLTAQMAVENQPQRSDGSIFVSVASYRDVNCPLTLAAIYRWAKHPEKVFIGLVDQVRR